VLQGVVLAALVLPLPAAGEAVPFDSDRWTVKADTSRVEEHLGRTSLFLDGGAAWVTDSKFTDGVIEYDIAFTGERGFMAVMWRGQDEGNYEEFYVRPHMSGFPDANQYTPAHHGLTSWQLYHGAGYGAPVTYKNNEWNHIKVVVSGLQAEVYINNMDEPALFVPEQKRPVKEGRVGVNAYFASAHYSNFRFQPGDPPPFRGKAPEMPEAAPGTISTWLVTGPFDEKSLDGTYELPAAMKMGTPEKLSVERSGLANLAPLHARSDGRDTLLARVFLLSPKAQTVKLRFGYSDRVRLYLGGRLLYAGDNTYRSRDYRYLGTIGYFDELFLPLEEGENELSFAVSESFGGWGLQALLEDADGVTVAP
jgi:hypothetical protein